MPHTLQIILVFLAGLLTGVVPVALMYYIKSKGLNTDSLTGLPDYRCFYRQLEKRIKQLNNHGKPFGVVLIDIDDFHRYNRSGYESGDSTLQTFANHLSRSVSGIAFCARFRMGDEFVLLFEAGKENEVRETLAALNNGVMFTYSLEIFRAKLISAHEAVKRLQLQLFENKAGKRRM